MLDLVLLMPLALLLRIAARLRGSHVGGGLGAGARRLRVPVRSATSSFAYFSALGEQHLDAYVHATYVLSYALMTGGAHGSWGLLAA